MAKSTFKVADILERVNTMLSKEHNQSNPSLELLLESILMNSGNYEGYQQSKDGNKFFKVSDKLKAEYLTLQSSRDARGCR